MCKRLRLSQWGDFFSVPFRALLVGVRDVEHCLLVKRFSHYLKSYRKLLGTESAWNRYSRQSRYVAGDGEDVGKVHFQGVVCFFAYPESSFRRSGARYDVDFFPRVLEIPYYQGPCLLRFQVIRRHNSPWRGRRFQALFFFSPRLRILPSGF